MPLIKKSAAVLTGATVDNVLAGSAFEFLPYNANVRYAINGSATGFVATVQSGADILMEESPINIQNRFGVFPDDFDLQDVAGAGERQVVKLRNTSAGTLTYFVTLQVDPM